MGICGSLLPAKQPPPSVDQDTENAVKLIERKDSKILDARVLHFRAELLWKKYQGTLAVIGTGISGDVRVVRKRNCATERLFALKSVDKNAVDPSRMPDFIEEVKIMKQLDHPNIVKLYETYEDKDTLYMILGLCTGGELYHALARAKKFSERRASILVKQMLSAILYCHSKGITHRDLKLENFVFRDKDGPGKDVLQLIDFGLSKRHVVKKSRRMTMIVGSAYYCAPEVLDGAYTNACDLWSIGVLTYMLITGAPPFNGQSIEDVVDLVRRQRQVRFQPFKVSNMAKEFIRGLLDIDPKTRWTAKQALGHEWVNPLRRRSSKEVAKIAASKSSDSMLERTGATCSPAKPVHLPAQFDDATAKRIAKRVTRFATYSCVRKLALLLNVSNISSDEEQIMGQLFGAMDTNFTGRLFRDELEQGFREAGITFSNFAEIFSGIDQDGSGRIQYSQFLAATCESCDLADEGVRNIFLEILDVDGDGKVSCDDLRRVLGPSFSKEYVSKLIKEVDTAADGRISLDEFMATMSNGQSKERAGDTRSAGPVGASMKDEG
eukprot:g2234.t1